jgi:hypothetical protein
MHRTTVIAAIAWLALLPVLAEATDLTKIERAIGREPTYTTKPKYGLLVFGPDAKSRVWLVLDGDVLYVDKNGNGDLTEKNERIKQAPILDKGHGFAVGELSLPEDRFPRNSSGLAIYRDTKHGAGALGFTITINQKIWLGRIPKLADRPADAPILHFNFDGPLTFVCLDVPAFVPGKETKLLIHIGTPGVGEKTCVWRENASSIVGGEVNLLVEIEYPNKDPAGKPLVATHLLALRE